MAHRVFALAPLPPRGSRATPLTLTVDPAVIGKRCMLSSVSNWRNAPYRADQSSRRPGSLFVTRSQEELAPGGADGARSWRTVVKKFSMALMIFGAVAPLLLLRELPRRRR